MERIASSVLVLAALFLNSCMDNEKLHVVTGEDEIVYEAGKDLTRYLSETYPNKTFLTSDSVNEGTRNIVLQINSDSGLPNDEAFRISNDGNLLIIRGKTPRALVNGVYGLLKELGWSFHLSFEVPPEKPGPLHFPDLQFENSPKKDKRIIFNWHNFLSGCTGWDFEQWEQWIDNASKVGFNTIMVHAYGNNPMQSFSMNGREKEVGYLTTTLRGRDWGAQHVNDVRLLSGGEIFNEYEFGSTAAKVPKSERASAATSLMRRVFSHAAQKAMRVCFAVDVDTWMANPQNIINTLPEACLLEIAGYKIVNPEVPAGRAYYEAQLKKLISDYPEVTMLAAWMRHPRKNPGQGSIWLQFDSQTLPEKWRKEYLEILQRHPDLTDERPFPGLFAISKIVQVYRDILDEVRPDMELVLGSWRLDYPSQADPFMPEYCGFIPLDWEHVFDNPAVVERLSEVGKHRQLYPIVWAHHDDHRYIGRPYKPFEGLSSLLNETNSAGYGIIHWMTHPLDLVFNNYENQVWTETENQSLEESSREFAKSLSKDDDNNLIGYYNEWFNRAPMFGRETSDNFIQPSQDYELEGYLSSLEVVEEAKKRLSLLGDVKATSLKTQGLREFNYQLGMEEFIVSFFQNHHNLHQAFVLLKDEKPDEAMPFILKLDPLEAIDLYAKTIMEYGATKGEQGVLVSLNLRWLPDYLDIKQRVGIESVRVCFQPTSHDPLAQGAGKNTFFIDDEKAWWLSLGEKEAGIPAETNGNLPLRSISDSWIEISEGEIIPLKTMRSHNLPAGRLNLRLIPAPGSAGCVVEVVEDGNEILSAAVKDFRSDYSASFETSGGSLSARIAPTEGSVRLAGLVVEFE